MTICRSWPLFILINVLYKSKYSVMMHAREHTPSIEYFVNLRNRIPSPRPPRRRRFEPKNHTLNHKQSPYSSRTVRTSRSRNPAPDSNTYVRIATVRIPARTSHSHSCVRTDEACGVCVVAGQTGRAIAICGTCLAFCGRDGCEGGGGGYG